MSIAYRAGYKYQLFYNYAVQVSIFPKEDVILGPIRLAKDGMLTITKGYAWDGPSGPTFDTATFMRGSLVHDALYELMRDDKLDRSYKEQADRLLQRFCIEDGMLWIRAYWVYLGVRFFGGAVTKPSGRRRLYYAP